MTRPSSNQAISGVWASGFADGGSLDSAQEGLDFFKKLNDAGNFVPVIAKTATVASGETPIRIAWTYNGLADKDSLAGNPPIEVVVPTTGRFGGMYVQAISAYAPHPERRQALDGVPVLRRGPEPVAEGLLQPDPL